MAKQLGLDPDTAGPKTLLQLLLLLLLLPSTPAQACMRRSTKDRTAPGVILSPALPLLLRQTQ
jgi:hypothetical protein